MPIDLMNYRKGQPYVFVSYSHVDCNYVLPIVEKLILQNTNIWIDRMIEPSSIWDDEIAVHIQHCEIAICFISNNYLRSDMCIKELKYARSKGVPVLLVLLNYVEFPPGLDMLLQDVQKLKAYEIESETGILRQLLFCEPIKNCIRNDSNERAARPEHITNASYYGLEKATKSESSPGSLSGVSQKRKRSPMKIPLVLILCLLMILLSWIFSDTDWTKLLSNHFFNNDFVSLTEITPIKDDWIWNDGQPIDPRGNDYSNSTNYIIQSNHNSKSLTQITSAEYRLSGDYTDFSFLVVPHFTTAEDAKAVIRIYSDDGSNNYQLLYESDDIFRGNESQMISVDVSGINYLKIETILTDHAAVILYNLHLLA